MKEKLIGALGVVGAVIYYVFSLFISAMPFVMIGAPLWVTIILSLILQLFPIATPLFWIWGLVCAIRGVQDGWAIAYYILFVVLYLPFFLDCMMVLFYKIKNPKQRYCKFCGSPIDHQTKKCSGCGKQFFRLPSFRNICVVLLVLITGFCVLRIVQDKMLIEQLNAQVSELQAIVESRDSELETVKEELETSKQDFFDMKDRYRIEYSKNYDNKQIIKEMTPVYEYCQKKMVFTSELVKLYHKPNCRMIDEVSDISGAYTVSEAKRRGYTECFLCD